jgi:hypothetical protein
VRSNFGEQFAQLVGFAAEAHYEHAACVGMRNERSEDFTRMREVIAEL